MTVSPPSENLQRIGVLAYVPALLRRWGIDPAEVLNEAGLPVDALDDPNGTIRYKQMGLLVQVAAEKSRRPDFGLEIGQQIGTQSLGLVGDLMRTAPNLRTALRDFAAHQHRNAHSSVVYLLEYPEDALFGYAVYQPNVPGAGLICDGAALGAYRLLRELAGTGPSAAIEILLARSKPQDLEPYRRCFGVKLCFDARQTAVRFPLRWLDKEVVSSDPVRRALLEDRVKSLWHVGRLDTLIQLRRYLTVGLLQGQLSAEAVAMQLGLASVHSIAILINGGSGTRKSSTRPAANSRNNCLPARGSALERSGRSSAMPTRACLQEPLRDGQECLRWRGDPKPKQRS